MVIDATMQTVFAALFATASGAIGWLVAKLWVSRDEAWAKHYAMLEKQFDDQSRRKDLFDSLGKTIDGNTSVFKEAINTHSQAIKELRETFARELASVRTDIQRIKP